MNNIKSQIQITDLLTQSVINAQERRNLGEITELSHEELKNIYGGVIVCGGKINPPPKDTVVLKPVYTILLRW